MRQRSQQEFLRAAKKALGVTWDALAEGAGIAPRALKTYRMPATSQDFRVMPSVARASVAALVRLHQDAERHERSVRAYRSLLARKPRGKAAA